MQDVFNIALFLHILGGTFGLVAGLVNMLRRKGDKIHKRVGDVFVYSMLTAGLSSLILALIHPNYFLFMVGIFTLYMVASGKRYLHLKGLNREQKPKLQDWMTTLAMLLFGVVFIGLGIRSLMLSNLFGLVFTTFGMIGLLFVLQDIRNFRGLSKAKNFWLIAHIGRMCGAFIASLTAFLVVNAKYLPVDVPPFFLWLLPTILVVPFIVKWSREHAVQ